MGALIQRVDEVEHLATFPDEWALDLEFDKVLGVYHAEDLFALPNQALNTSGKHMKLIYLDIHHRFFDSSVSYTVAYSKELEKKLSTLTSKEQEAIKDIAERLKTRKSIVPYMSKQIRAISVKNSDFLLKNWNIYHLHLEKDSEGRSNGNLLFFNRKGALPTLLMCVPIPREVHGLIESYLILYMTYDNWPFLLNFRPDMKPTVSIPDEKVHDALKKMVLALPFKEG